MSKEIFISKLSEYFVPLGFSYLKSKKRFIKKAKGNVYIYSFEFFFSDTSRYEPSVALKLKEVEEIKKTAWGKLYNPDYDYTVGTDIAHMENRAGNGYPIGTSNDAIVRANEEIKFFQTTITEYFEKHSDLCYLDKVLNENPGEELLLNRGHIHTCFTAILVAYLVKNPSLNGLLDFYRGIVKIHNESFFEEFDLLTKYIKEHPKE